MTQHDDTPDDTATLTPIQKAILRETAKRLQAIIREHNATDSKGRRIATQSTLRTMAENIQKKENDLRSARG